ncbi:hypothetical protein BCV69DRAFT_265781 [Microstroma glucosiphilum]|uniref:SAC domain-containing protein n=1 Tax=Pseudomicrostroma glucosiphilum TaxID=1684307 RepID=A0A316UJS3_9BASI|nr:hypothetical protein BCV69DRAFT_265781 [Pseudomicrostroma glucosiphilum]PWN24223.1 hypothetical protein BCV69DRAFT_265781 [Pseudomicrostroma glucosiphilum]
MSGTLKGIFTGSPNRRGTTSSSQTPASPLSTSYSVPPFPVPQVDRSLTLHYTTNGLLIVPSQIRHGNSRPLSSSHSSGVRLSWERRPTPEIVKAAEVVRVLGEQGEHASIPCFGLIGMVKLYKNSYLLVITKRELAGDFLEQNKPVYRCSGVLAVPLCKDSAQVVLKSESQKAKSSSPASASDEEEDDSDDVSEGEESDHDDVATPSLIGRSSFLTGSKIAPSIPSAASEIRSSPLAASRMSASQHEDPQGLGDQGTVGKDETTAVPHVKVNEAAAASQSERQAEDGLSAKDQEANREELEDKLVKEAARQYARGEMLFSYDFDLTTALQRKYDQVTATGVKPSNTMPFEEPRATLPLWRRAERKFFHNEFLSQEFITAGVHSMVLPLMQGYYQTSTLPIPAAIPEGDEVTATMTIISRRSKERPGLRYQRRGANDQGQVANFVETEQILHVRRKEGAQTHIFSFLQFRGSIPLYWSQNPFSMKPPPVLEGTKEQRALACSKHFEAQIERYGPITCVNLAEQKGREGDITQAFRESVEELESKGVKVKYQAFDFHKECAGMKFENVSKLIDTLQDSLKEMDCFWRAWITSSSGEKTSELKAVQHSMMRTNCLDCLDRTNVVQSAFGRHLLASQLARIGLALNPPPHEAYDAVFNELWANNGDLIANSYAGTRALKGDFTRTGKRNWKGMINDATASVYRMLQGAVSDFWRQTVISFIYGELTLNGLERYGEDLTTVDPSSEVRLRKVRAAAIDTCAEMALHEGETKIGGWTLFSPMEANTIRSSKLEEKIVLLTNKALYICAYDFQIEKLSEFSRILLGDVRGLKKGVYLISPRDGQHREQHWGLVVSYLSESRRINSATIKNVPTEATSSPLDGGEAAAEGSKSGSSSPTGASAAVTGKENFIALKAIADEFAGTLKREPREKRKSRVLSANASAGVGGATGLPSSSSSSSAQQLYSNYESGELTSKEIVEKIVQLLVEECSDADACITEGVAQAEEGFVKEGDIQTLAEAKAQAPMLSGLIEGLRRRVWL